MSPRRMETAQKTLPHPVTYEINHLRAAFLPMFTCSPLTLILGFGLLHP